jgi:predicted hotdog family 3-hydroxylacyl-ACP dehydratase
MTYPALTSFMPHRPPMLLLDTLVEHGETLVVCDKTFREGEPFVENGAVSALVTIELFAQAAAAHFGYAGYVKGGAMSSGALLGARRIDLDVPTFSVGERLVIRATQVMFMAPAAQYECELEQAGRVVARGSINVAMGIG